MSSHECFAVHHFHTRSQPSIINHSYSLLALLLAREKQQSFLFVTALKSTVLLLRPCWATAPRLCHVTVHVHACTCAIYHATVAIITDKHRAYGYQQLLAKYAYTVCVRVPILNLLVTSWTMASVTAICLQKSFRSFHGASSSSGF